MPDAVVLLVEDESILRMNAVQLVEDAGYSVIEAANADEAILLLECRSDIRFVITDIHMPGSMDGLRLSHAIRERWPPVHLILTSGIAMPHICELPTDARFIPKPYEAAHIIDALNHFGL